MSPRTNYYWPNAAIPNFFGGGCRGLTRLCQLSDSPNLLWDAGLIRHLPIPVEIRSTKWQLQDI